MQRFSDVIGAWPTVAIFAAEVGTNERTAMSWFQRDSIPADWFAPVARAALARGILGATEFTLAAIAERRRLTKGAERNSSEAAA